MVLLERSGRSKGCKGKEEWEVILYLSEFCQALELFVTQIETELDWSSIHDFDLFYMRPPARLLERSLVQYGLISHPDEKI